MGPKRNKRTQKNSKNSIKNVTRASKKEGSEPPRNEGDAHNSYNYIKTPEGVTIKLSMNVQSEEDPAVIEISKRANRIGIFSIIISAIMTLVTVYTFFQTKKSVDIAMEGFENSKSQFLKINKPFLEVKNVLVKKFEINEPMEMDFEIHNIGNFPVELISSKLQNNINRFKPPWDIIDDGTSNLEPLNMYVANGNPAFFSNKSPLAIDSLQYNALMKDRWGAYFLGYYVYKNLITEDSMKFYFMIKWDLKQKTYSILENKNIPYDQTLNFFYKP